MQIAAAEQAGGELYLYTVAEYGEIYGISFIVRYETFSPNQIEDFQGLLNTWDEFGRIAEGYTWWAAPEMVKQ